MQRKKQSNNTGHNLEELRMRIYATASNGFNNLSTFQNTQNVNNVINNMNINESGGNINYQTNNSSLMLTK